MSVFAAVKIVAVMENVINLLGIELQPLTGLPSVQTLPDFTQFQFTYFQNSAFLKSNKNGIITLLKSTPTFFVCENESVRRQKWRKNTAGR
jgi:hypothetical protein